MSTDMISQVLPVAPQRTQPDRHGDSQETIAMAILEEQRMEFEGIS